MKTWRLCLCALTLVPTLSGAAMQSDAAEMTNYVPPTRCNSEFARLYMAEHVANRLFVPLGRIASIATLGGAGGDGSAEGIPGSQDYTSDMRCPIRVTFVGGGMRYMTYNERYSARYGEEYRLSPFVGDPSDPSLRWIDTKSPH